MREGLRREDILDFSASLNPLGPPESVLQALKGELPFINHYPDPECTILKETISEVLDLPGDFLLCGNGSTELIYLIVRALRPERVLIPIPTFSEYERAVKPLGTSVEYLLSNEEKGFQIDPGAFIKKAEAFRPRIAFLCNPNNPTGGLLGRREVLQISDMAKTLKMFLVVDEAFVDFIPEESVIQEVIDNPFLIVLRSLTKFYGLAGLRVGYGVLHPSVMKEVALYKEPWTVNTLAQVAGAVALRDDEFRQRTITLLAAWKAQMEGEMRHLGIRYLPSAANFYLLRFGQDTHVLCEELRKRGLLVRPCANFRGLGPKYIRVAVRTPEENKNLLQELITLSSDLSSPYTSLL